MDLAHIKGFNYQPSYGTSGLELWLNFDPAVVDRELGLGKQYFPRMNAIRLWLSWEAFKRSPARFRDHFSQALDLAGKYDLRVMPVLFNRWHDGTLDYGGIYLDHFLPGVSWVQRNEMFHQFMEAAVGEHASDPRIFAWDLCNEPFSYGCPPEQIPEIVRAEYAWLESLYQQCKALGAQAPVTVGIHMLHGENGIAQIEPISDLLSIHPYWTAGSPPHEKAAFERLLDRYVDFAKKAGKPLIATETVWGARDDQQRVEIIRYTLSELQKRGIGWLAYLLHHSLIADAHRPEFGPLSDPGNLAFIEADGRLRPGHEAFNEFF